MNIIVAVRCYNEERNISRFIEGYDFADKIIISDGGSTDQSLDILAEWQGYRPGIEILHFDQFEIINDVRWNPDNPHINFVLNAAKAECGQDDWIIFDDMDDVPNYKLRENAIELLTNCDKDQVNVFRLYMWGENEYFPKMNNYFDTDYRSLWAWKPNKIDIHADESLHHGTIVGTIGDNYKVELPMCLLHRSWMPDTIDAKVIKYNKLNIPMNHPVDGTFGPHEPLPEFAHE